jgi:hypothetical protein
MQVNSIRLRVSHRLDGLGIAGRNDALATDGKCFNVGPRLNAGKDLAIEENEIQISMLRERGRR